MLEEKVEMFKKPQIKKLEPRISKSTVPIVPFGDSSKTVIEI